MTAPAVLRVWRGWRADHLQGEAGAARFLEMLGETFIPATWQVMRHYGLRAYLPSTLDMTRSAALPDEAALLFFTGADAYERARETVAGRSYAVMHEALFRFSTTGPSSTSVVAQAWPPGPGSGSARLPAAWWRPARSGGARMESPDAGVIFVACTHAPDLHEASHAISRALDLAEAGAVGEAVLLSDTGYLLVWLAFASACDAADMGARLAAALPHSRCVCAHVARQIRVKKGYFDRFSTGAPVQWGQTLRLLP